LSNLNSSRALGSLLWSGWYFLAGLGTHTFVQVLPPQLLVGEVGLHLQDLVIGTFAGCESMAKQSSSECVATGDEMHLVG